MGVLFDSYGSILESEDLGIDLTQSIFDSDILINPEVFILVCKAVIINLPLNINLSNLSKYNDIYSRFPIEGCQLVPYAEPANKVDINKEDYSLKILNKYVMNSSDPDIIKELSESNYLIGIESDIQGYLTAVGYKLMKTNLEKLKTEDNG